MQLKAIDVAIGMAFLYLLLTFLASAVVELVSNIRNWRSQILYFALEKMLEGNSAVDVKLFYDHPLIQALATNQSGRSWMDLLERGGWKPPGGTASPVAYVPAAIFSGVVLEFIRRSDPGRTTLTPEDEIKAVAKWLNTDAPRSYRHTAAALHAIIENAIATQGNSIQAVKLSIEKWFNDTMDRTSGWYKRRTRGLLILVGLVLALVGNIDSIALAKWLWEGDAARQTVVAAAADYAKANPKLPETGASAPKGDGKSPDILASVKQIVDVDRKVTELGYPMGVERLVANFSSKNLDFFWLAQYILGCIISAIAISMGSPFWFDAMQNLLKLRGSGPKPGVR